METPQINAPKTISSCQAHLRTDIEALMQDEINTRNHATKNFTGFSTYAELSAAWQRVVRWWPLVTVAPENWHAILVKVANMATESIPVPGLKGPSSPLMNSSFAGAFFISHLQRLRSKPSSASQRTRSVLSTTS
jgi:hypothetical protein